jgi:hypothetical protein
VPWLNDQTAAGTGVDYVPAALGHLSVTVVLGRRRAVSGVTYRPVIALRELGPPPPLPVVLSVTVVRGLLRATAAGTNRPVDALLLRVPAMPRTSRSFWQAVS